jgi:chromosomal replication initiator protein
MLSIRSIQQATCEAHGITLDEMLAEGKARRFSVPRQIAMYLAHYHSRRSLPTIARLFERDHSTVIHGIRAVRDHEDRMLAAGRIREALL